MSDRGSVRRREFIRLSAITAGAALVSACLPQKEGNAPFPSPERLGQFEVGPLEGGTLMTDTAQFPKAFKDAPELAQLVRDGRLPPVGERIGLDPLVLRPVNGVGRYGGTLRRAFNGPNDWTNSARFCCGPDRLLYWDYRWERVTPWLARSYDLSADGRALTLQLRRGMRWSDGAPFTADDIIFWYQDIYLFGPLTASRHPNMQINGRDVAIVKLDQYTVRYESPEPNPLLPELLASWTVLGGMATWGGRQGQGGFAPKHYLSKFHPNYTRVSEIETAAKAAGFNSWVPYFRNRAEWNYNPDLPVLTPWKVRAGNEIHRITWILDRNPYSVYVDTDGNQLPYIDTVHHTLGENLEVISLRAAAGEYDFQDRHLDMAKIPVLLQNQEKSGYRIHLNPSEGNDFGIRLNLAYNADKEVGDLLRIADFRRALSMGIDRAQIIETFFLGAARPSSFVPASSNKYYPGAEWTTKWATLDVEKANGLLDGLGYVAKDADGYRLRKDGKGLLVLDYQAQLGNFADFVGMGEMIKQQWKKIGIELRVQGITGTLAVERAAANQLQLAGQQVGSEDLFIYPDTAFPFQTSGYQALIGVPYARWFQSNGTQGTEPFRELKELMELWRKGYAAPQAERVRIGKEWWAKAADLVLQIGVVTQDLATYGIHYAKTTLGNVPRRVVNSVPGTSMANALPQTFYYK